MGLCRSRPLPDEQCASKPESDEHVPPPYNVIIVSSGPVNQNPAPRETPPAFLASVPVVDRTSEPVYEDTLCLCRWDRETGSWSREPDTCSRGTGNECAMCSRRVRLIKTCFPLPSESDILNNRMTLRYICTSCLPELTSKLAARHAAKYPLDRSWHFRD